MIEKTILIFFSIDFSTPLIIYNNIIYIIPEKTVFKFGFSVILSMRSGPGIFCVTICKCMLYSTHSIKGHLIDIPFMAMLSLSYS